MIKVLIADDHSVVRRLGCNFTEHFGIEVAVEFIH